jgi:hypothetical protein
MDELRRISFLMPFSTTMTALALLLMIGHRAGAAGTTTVINLSCDGTTTLGDGPSDPVKNMGLIVNLTNRTVLGFGVPAQR